MQEVLKIFLQIFNLKAVLLVGGSSELSTNAVIRMKVDDFKNDYGPKTKITTLDMRRGKVRFDFMTFLSTGVSRHPLPLESAFFLFILFFTNYNNCFL